MKNYDEYYEIQWYDDSYAGCWKFNNRFNTLDEAKEFISSNRCVTNVKLRIVHKIIEVVKYY